MPGIPGISILSPGNNRFLYYTTKDNFWKVYDLLLNKNVNEEKFRNIDYFTVISQHIVPGKNSFYFGVIDQENKSRLLKY